MYADRLATWQRSSVAPSNHRGSSVLQETKRRLVEDLAARRQQVQGAVLAAHKHQRQLVGDAYRSGHCQHLACGCLLVSMQT